MNTEPKNLRAPLTLTAAAFVNVARPGDVFTYEGKRYAVESVGLFPVAIWAYSAGVRCQLYPGAAQEIIWEGVTP
jgi:hypothetical protein